MGVCFYFCVFITFIAFIITAYYYGRSLSEIKRD